MCVAIDNLATKREKKPASAPQAASLKQLLKAACPRAWYLAAFNLYLRLRYPFIWPAWRGTGFCCNLCGREFRRKGRQVAAISVNQRLKIIGQDSGAPFCPYCHSRERERSLYFFLSQHTNLFRDRLRVLHIAPELALGRLLRRARNLSYSSADLASKLASDMVDITRMPYANESFDVVICNHVLEHVPDDATAMWEVFRVLKPGGWAVLQVPISPLLSKTYEDFSITAPAARERAFGQYDHVRVYGADYVERLRRAGFEVTPSHVARELGDTQVQRHAMVPDEQIFFCVKPPVANTGDTAISAQQIFAS